MSDEGTELVRFLRHLPRDADLTLIVLKGHLLVEEQIVALLEQAVPNPAALRKARLTFAQRLRLLQALKPKASPRILAGAERLNKLRNALAHELEPADIPSAIDALAKAAGTKRIEMSEHDEPLSSATELRRAIAAIAGALTGMRFQYKELQIPEHHSNNSSKPKPLRGSA